MMVASRSPPDLSTWSLTPPPALAACTAGRAAAARKSASMAHAVDLDILHATRRGKHQNAAHSKPRRQASRRCACPRASVQPDDARRKLRSLRRAASHPRHSIALARCARSARCKERDAERHGGARALQASGFHGRPCPARQDPPISPCCPRPAPVPPAPQPRAPHPSAARGITIGSARAPEGFQLKTWYRMQTTRRMSSLLGTLPSLERG